MITIKSFAVGYLQTNCYIVTLDGQPEAAIIDPGGGYALGREYLELNGKIPSAVLLTHGHFDHILDAAKYQSDGARVYVHELDSHALDKGGSLAREMGIRMQPLTPDEVFFDGDEICVGAMKFKALHTPGHTRGSCCFIIENYIFSGDTLFAESYGRTDFAGGSMADMIKSLSRLFALEGNYKVFPGHMEDTMLSHEREYNPIPR
ncbi:MAG: MBL fold metallo-hydrolase [Clostridia bacterium]|nr:MBL fold metallo-hydrolase [Clostridia bacterium]